MNFDKNMASADLDALFDCRGNEIGPVEENGAMEGCPLAMVYAPYQTFRNVYKCHEALSKGTLFSDLYLPFEGCK